MIALFLVITLCLFCDVLSLLRDKEKRHKLPDVCEILLHFPLLLSNMKIISCVKFELDFRGQIFTRRRSIAVAM